MPASKIRTLRYWVAKRIGNGAFSIRKKTKAEVLQELKTLGLTLRKDCSGDKYWGNPNDAEDMQFSHPFQVVVEYRTVFSLICQALGEGGIE